MKRIFLITFLVLFQITFTGCKKEERISPELQQGLDVLRKTLPIVNKEEGTAITAVDVNAKMELEYRIVIENTEAASHKMDVMKENVIRNPDFKEIIRNLSPYGITSMRFVYFTNNGKKLGDFSISTNDIKP